MGDFCVNNLASSSSGLAFVLVISVPPLCLRDVIDSGHSPYPAHRSVGHELLSTKFTPQLGGPVSPSHLLQVCHLVVVFITSVRLRSAEPIMHHALRWCRDRIGKRSEGRFCFSSVNFAWLAVKSLSHPSIHPLLCSCFILFSLLSCFLFSISVLGRRPRAFESRLPALRST
ncbi:hypothetical protein B0H12DRAFT_846824 [Mycena haematopus]|nr:hypothetical protein B0H12DRAFT_846824 [Mycena haematopus]